ncbi:hypothetical protein E7Z59_07895 [Robertkochia marina]|uniref:DUF1611 domain-containing protein n=1 Tax=Robertkochia marina TaxID=1227945 RepID=A0A4S3LZP0_9FLAO|nr:hypothetical protein [Robertkochia marina]THD67574.1 hypothetical protein E7Z59_07895 [Robertkochia marina]TRZ44558.1 hypothetical protein D3A96_08050 [Robertkochia marina]
MRPSSYIFTTLTRISDLEAHPFEVKKLHKDRWASGDYVVSRITGIGSSTSKLELPNGRMRGVIGGELVVGALGVRHATLEATGTWKEVQEDGEMHMLSGGGLMGKLTSKSMFIPEMIPIRYEGHVMRGNEKCTMGQFVTPCKERDYMIPTVLFIGTSMSAGKTTSARIVTSLLTRAGYKVLGAKITGTGRFRDILAVKDVGAVEVYDFVDAGLPTTVCDPELYREKLKHMLSCMAASRADVAVVEIGASPLEPYNGDLAYEGIKEQVKCCILSASDPYAVYGLMAAFEVKPDLVTGISANTLGGQEMVETLCGVPAMNLLEQSSIPRLKSLLRQKLGVKV